MRATRALWQQRQPMIKFLGKRTTPSKVDHSPKPHPASPSHSLPDNFAAYRQNAQQHGPLKSDAQSGSSSGPAPSGGSSGVAQSYGGKIGSHSGKSLGSIQPTNGQFFDRTDLPARFQRTPWSQAEIDAVESGGASMFA